MRSRWTDFLTTAGENPWRDREEEFTDHYHAREEVEHDWEAGWDTLFMSLEKLGPVDLTGNVTIRDEPEVVIGVIHRQLAHYGYHIGQIIVLCRTLAGKNWSTLTVPRSKAN